MIRKASPAMAAVGEKNTRPRNSKYKDPEIEELVGLEKVKEGQSSWIVVIKKEDGT